MQPARVGAALRAIRRRLGWTLARAAAMSGLSSAVASRIENGRFDLCSYEAVEAYARALGADLEMFVRWRGGDLDRLLNRRHSAMHEAMAAMWPLYADWLALQ